MKKECRVLLFVFRYEDPSFSGAAVAQWLRCCAANWKVAGSISAGMIVIFH